MSKQACNQPQKNYLPILQEMEFSDDRTTAIVAAVLIDNNLPLAIMARLIDLDEAEKAPF